MIKKNKGYIYDFKAPLLHREDFIEIESIILNELSPEKFVIDLDGEWEASNISDIPLDYKYKREVILRTYSPYMSCTLSKNFSYIYTNDDNLKTIGVITKIVDLIKNKERSFLIKFRQFMDVFVPFFVGISVAEMLSGAPSMFDDFTKSGKIIVSIVLVTVLILNFLRLIMFNTSSILIFDYHKNSKNFFVRNKDTLLVGIIMAIITIVLTQVFK